MDWIHVDYLWCFYQLFELILTAPKKINSVIKEDSLKNDGN